MESVQKSLALNFDGAGLRYEGLSKGVVASDEELVPLVQAFQDRHGRYPIRLPGDAAVAATTGEDEIPDPVHQCAESQGLERMRKEVVDVRRLGSGEREAIEAVETVALLISAKGFAHPGNWLASSRSIDDEQ